MGYGYRDVLTRALMARRISRLTAGAALAAVLATAPGAARAASLSGLGLGQADAERALREHRMKTLDGHPLSLGDLEGRVVVVNFWASWCAPCRRELPRLSKLQAELPAQSVRVLAVSIDEDANNAGRFCRAQDVKLQVAHDGPDGLARTLDLKNVPLTLVLDRAGRITYTTTRSDDRGLAAVAAEARRLMALPAESGGPAAGDSR